MRIKLFIIAFLSIAVYNSNAQNENETRGWKDRIFFGGNMGMVFGSITYIEVSPTIGYYITPRWAAGAGTIYKYYKSNYIPKYDTHIYGGSVFTRYILFPDFSEYFPVGEGLSMYAHVEYESINLEEIYFRNSVDLSERSGRFWLNSYLVGGGISQKLGRRGGINISVLWNLNDTQDSFYTNPIIRFGFVF